MAYSHNAPFRADVVGSYLRPAELKQARADFAAGAIDAAALKAVEDRLITELVAKQKDVYKRQGLCFVQCGGEIGLPFRKASSGHKVVGSGA